MLLVRRSSFLLTLLFALVALLTACGSQGANVIAPAPTAAPTAVPVQTPEERVKGFFDTFTEALNDPQIAEEARKKEWVEKLVAYAPPAEQEGTRTNIVEALDEFTGLNLGELSGQPGLDVRMEVLFRITETKLVEENGDNATVEIVDGLISMKPVGPDVEKLGDTASAFTQEVPIKEFFSDASQGDSQIKLVRVDGIWYLVNALGTSS
jgi:hypothetical protein